MEYFVLESTEEETNVLIDKFPEKVEKWYQLSEGVSRLENWPDDIPITYSI